MRARGVVRAAAMAGVLAVTLTAAAAPQQPRFRYIGKVGNFAVMATEPTGPRTDRRSTVVIANTKPVGPGGADNATLDMTFDCVAVTSNTFRSVAYLGEDETVREDEIGEASAPTPNSPNALEYHYACDGTVPEGEAIWATGEKAARDTALKLVGRR